MIGLVSEGVGEASDALGSGAVVIVSFRSRDGCRVRGARPDDCALGGGGTREVLEALREGGPTNKEGAGRRWFFGIDGLLDIAAE